MAAVPRQRLVAAALMLLLSLGAGWAQESPPASVLEFVQPPAGAVLQGLTEIRVSVTPAERVPAAVYVSFYGPPWFPLKRQGTTNEWSAQIDSRLTGNGDATLVARAYYAGEAATARAESRRKVSVDNPLQVFFGSLHGHSGYSDGRLFPADIFTYARDVARLDFFALTDHLEGMTPQVWADIRDQTWKANQDGVFVTLTGLEWTKPVGHACVFDPPFHVWPLQLTDFYAAASAARVIAKFNHPGNGEGVFEGLAYVEAGKTAMRLIEVRNDIEERAYIRALRQGWHVAPDGSDDCHSIAWGQMGTWTAVVMPGLSRTNLWAALQNRHCYSTGDRNCRLLLRVNGALMGDVVTVPCREVRVEVEVTDDPDDPASKIELYEDGEIVRTDLPEAAARQWQVTLTPPAGPHYYFVRATQADGNKLWSAPVWITVAEP